jgi:hypothetical protein
VYFEDEPGRRMSTKRITILNRLDVARHARALLAEIFHEFFRKASALFQDFATPRVLLLLAASRLMQLDPGEARVDGFQSI